MSGHSKWSTIKHKKAATDARRSKLWSKLSRYVTIAARGGGNPDDNPRLRLAVDKARAANMPKDTIDKAIKKGTGELAGETFEEVVYEGYGPGGVAIMCQVVTDNRNRTSPEIKKLFERRGGNLGAPNSVAWQFHSKGVITIDKSAISEDALMEIALENGADDVTTQGDVFEVTCDPDVFSQFKSALEAADIPLQSADITLVADTLLQPPDLDTARKILNLLDDLDEHDDVANVSSNCDLPDELMAELTG